MPTCTVTSRIFDVSQDILWTGDSKGRISGYFNNGTGMGRYTSFSGHSRQIHEILTSDRGLISVSKDTVKLHNRRGVVKQTVTDPALKSVSAMAYSTKGTSEVVVAGEQKDILRINMERGVVSSKVPHQTNGGSGHGNGSGRNHYITKMIRSGMHIAMGSSNGVIDIIDPNTLHTVRTLPAHSGPISDMDCSGSTVMSCAYSPRKNGCMPEPLVSIFDLRAMKPLPPVAFPAGAAFVRTLPKLSSCCVVASPSGQIQFIDIANSANVYLYQSAASSPLNGIDISPSGDFMSITDVEGFVQLWTNDTTSQKQSTFAEFPGPIEFPTDNQDEYIPQLDLDDLSTPLSSIGLPYYKSELLSSWSDRLVFNSGMPPAKIGPDVLDNMKTSGFVGYATNPKHKPRNLAQEYVSFERQRRSSITVPKFISEKERTGETDDQGELFAETDPSDPSRIPKAYRKLEIKYSKFGVVDFDFDFYNNTQYSGLETQLANSYTNALLQLYRFCPAFYNFALKYVSQYNAVDYPSLLNELGLLFDMLYKADGKHCRASNFLKILSNIPQASALGLIYDDIHNQTNTNNNTNNSSNDNDNSNNNINPGSSDIGEGALLQAFGRFLMERISYDELQINEQYQSYYDNGDGNQKTEFESLTGLPVDSTSKFHPCGTEAVRSSIVYSIELSLSTTNNPPPSSSSGSSSAPPSPIPSSNSKPQKQQQQNNFLDSLQRSIEKWTQTRGYCDNCKKYQNMGTLKVIRKLPHILNITIPLSESESPEVRKAWAASSWPAKEFVASTVRGRLSVRKNGDGDKYKLLGCVVEISSPGKPDNHLVCIVKIDREWYLFNDFLVNKLSEKEALDFSVPWKKPVLLLYQTSISSKAGFNYESWKDKMDTTILYRDHFATTRRGEIAREYELLTQEEAPQPGTLVAIDAEFVMLQQEETEIRSDGTKSLLRPTVLSLARVSVLRGTGPKEGVAFIDDYIATTDPIVDYLTEFSGIEPGDLDPSLTKRDLVTLQTSYKKLWLLLNLGCVFIGHGLYNDFRTINIRVPDSQVIDTVDIYFKPRQRKLSLKFLAWYLLDSAVQTGNHDSIEDAKTALRLYQKYGELKEKGIYERTLDELYNEGRKWNYKPPANN